MALCSCLFYFFSFLSFFVSFFLLHALLNHQARGSWCILILPFCAILFILLNSSLHLSTLLSSCLSTSLLLNTCFVLTRTHAQVEFPEFVELINRLDRGTTHSEEAVLAAFRHFDPDGSGFVEEPEVRLT